MSLTGISVKLLAPQRGLGPDVTPPCAQSGRALALGVVPVACLALRETGRDRCDRPFRFTVSRDALAASMSKETRRVIKNGVALLQPLQPVRLEEDLLHDSCVRSEGYSLHTVSFCFLRDPRFAP
jgi:hypothetical protein